MIKVAILTISDSCAQGIREDTSGQTIEEMLLQHKFEISEKKIVPDDCSAIAAQITHFSDQSGVDLVLTTGGTGLGPRDVTPEATVSICDRVVPGLGEVMRAEGLKHTHNAILSRSVAGIRGKTLVINLPGSPGAVRECLGSIIGVLPHAVEMIAGGGH
jgi:molybdenum cofactor synthesis domain-containing protein